MEKNRQKEEQGGNKSVTAGSMNNSNMTQIGDIEKGEHRMYGGKAHHNTLMLLQHYRTIAWLMECFPRDIAAELDRPFEGLDLLIEQMDLEVSWGNRKLESRMEAVEKTRLLLDRVNEALTVLKKKPGNGEKLYQLVYLSYIGPERLSHTELLYRLDLSSRSYYRLRQQALTILSIRLWSAPAQEVGAWLDMLAIAEGME